MRFCGSEAAIEDLNSLANRLSVRWPFAASCIEELDKFILPRFLFDKLLVLFRIKKQDDNTHKFVPEGSVTEDKSRCRAKQI